MKKSFLLSFLILFSCLSFSSITDANSADLSGVWIEEGRDPYSMSTVRYRITKTTGDEYHMASFAHIPRRNPRRENYYFKVEDFVISGSTQIDWSELYDNSKLWERSVYGTLDSDGNTLRISHQNIQPFGSTGDMADSWHEFQDDRIFVRYQ